MHVPKINDLQRNNKLFQSYTVIEFFLKVYGEEDEDEKMFVCQMIPRYKLKF